MKANKNGPPEITPKSSYVVQLYTEEADGFFAQYI